MELKVNFAGFFKIDVTMCANSLYGGGPKTLLTDQHLLRTNLFFVTETSELRLAGLHLIQLTELCSQCWISVIYLPRVMLTSYNFNCAVNKLCHI